MSSREPRIIELPELGARRHIEALLPTVVDHPVLSGRSRCRKCQGVMERTDRFCGHCGIRLIAR